MITSMLAWVISFSDDIYCCDDLISAVHKASESRDNSISCGGVVRGETLKSKHAHAFYSVYALRIIMSASGFYTHRSESIELRRLSNISNIKF